MMGTVSVMHDTPLNPGWQSCFETIRLLIGMEMDSSRQVLLQRYVQNLLFWNQTYNLIGPEAVQTLLTRHLPNSCALLPWLPGSGKIADMGSGAGMPGVILAIVSDSSRQFYLYESNQKKIRFLTHIRTELGLSDRLTIMGQRVEEPHSESNTFQVVICRALADLPEIARLARFLLLPEGVCLALKGRQIHKEVQQLSESRQAKYYSPPLLHAIPGDPEGSIVQLQQVSRETGMHS